ncbi:MAG: cell wall-binding repeat-containing protein [Euzebya sp.]
MTRRPLLLVILCVSALLVPLVGASAQDAGDPSQVGSFSATFVEPEINGTVTEDKCIPRDDGSDTVVCKPAAGSIALLADNRLLYWSNLEATENIQQSTVLEFGRVAENDQSRVLTMLQGTPSWMTPSPSDGGVNENEAMALAPDGSGIDEDHPRNAEGAMFGADHVFLADGEVLVAGGTDYYQEFGQVNNAFPDFPLAVSAVELEGISQSRIFDPGNNTFRPSGDMNFGRWYPTATTLGDGRVLMTSGVQKLIKPIYPDQPPEDSGRNVVQQEIYDPETGQWELLPESADRSLPLYPRMHLLPNGHVLYNTSGQTWNPAGEAYDQALWNMAATFNPTDNTWTDQGVPLIGSQSMGYLGSNPSVMLPLQVDENGEYSHVEFLNAGGVFGPPPGSYIATSQSRIMTVDVAGDDVSYDARQTDPLNVSRWYGAGTLLPTGEVLISSGADRDEVINPGSEAPRLIPELFDPETETWTQMAPQNNGRTYHNSAVLLPDGRVLIGGHNPIPTGYTAHGQVQAPGSAPNDGRDPTFEFFSPPYLFRGDRPGITNVVDDWSYGSQVQIDLDIPATEVADVILMRRTAMTHIIDADQRGVVLPITSRDGNSITVQAPPDGNVAPMGPYMLFVNRDTAEGKVPSVAASIDMGAVQVQVERFGGPDRIDTAARVAASTFAQADTVVLARSDEYADALAGAPLAHSLDSPLLLTQPDQLSGPTQEALSRLGTSTVVVLGGEAAISPAVTDALTQQGISSERIGGSNRFGTAAAIADRLGPSARVFITEGENTDPNRGWPDALVAAPYAAFNDQPILLVNATRVPPETAAALERSGAAEALVVGGTASVSEGVSSTIGQSVTVRRIAGADRYETAALVQTEAQQEGMSAATMWLATGLDWPDSLAAGPVIASRGDSLLLVDGNQLSASPATRARLQALAGQVSSLRLVGGEAAISRAVRDEALAILSG